MSLFVCTYLCVYVVCMCMCAICVNKCVDSCVVLVFVNKHVNNCCVIYVSPSGCESLRWRVSHMRSSSLHLQVLDSRWWGLVRWCLSISSFAFPDSDSHALVLWGCAWYSGHLLTTRQCPYHLRPISLTYLVCNACNSNVMAAVDVIIPFLVLQCDTINSCVILVFVGVYRTLCSTF